ncbi:hypothetical protein EVAR_64404_1 [Eumeta japonica]|uniref:Uncharacterized protein n=1 Tax=Eumeta variegata TaxID=151549 RepID=A0A4C1ZXG5_EUMVA|nr:hypothetical protein EVAR_64404_1 [Eumeta japonica]
MIESESENGIRIRIESGTGGEIIYGTRAGNECADGIRIESVLSPTGMLLHLDKLMSHTRVGVSLTSYAEMIPLKNRP